MKMTISITLVLCALVLHSCSVSTPAPSAKKTTQKVEKKGFEIRPSTYKVKNSEQVADYLKKILQQKLEEIKAQGLPETIINSDFKKFFTVKYCDDRVLKYLDALAEEQNKSIVKHIVIDFNVIQIDSLSTTSVVKFIE